MSALRRQASNRMLEPRLILLDWRYLKFSLGPFLVVATQETCRRINGVRGQRAEALEGMDTFESKKMAERRGIQ
jgi:hypothetical protein